MASMEEIIKKITSNDSAIIEEGTLHLRQALKCHESIPALCSLLQMSCESQIRQTAGLIIKKRFSKSKYWALLPENLQEGVKDSLLKALIAEPEKFVKNTIAQTVGTIVVAERKGWPELLHFLQQSTTSQDNNERELGFFTLSILTSIAADQFLQHVGSFSILFNNTLSNTKEQGSALAFYAIVCLTNFVPVISESPELKRIYLEVIPKVILSIRAMCTKRHTRAHEAMDLFYDLATTSTFELLTPSIKPLVNMCLDFIREPTVKTDIQIKACALLAIFVNAEMELILKKDLLVPILHVVLKVLCEKPVDEDDEDYFCSDPDDDTVLTSACETLDEIALKTDAQILMPHILDFVDRGLKGSDPYIHKACYLTIGIVSQGADSYIKNNCLAHFMSIVIKGMTAEQAVIRNAALFALGQFTDYLQPNVNQYVNDYLPVLLALLGKMEQRGKSSKIKNTADRIFFAIEKFLENMEGPMEGILPELMQKLIVLSCPPYETNIRLLALGAIANTASCVKEGIVPYFKPIMGVLNQYINQPATDENNELQVEAIDTLGVVIRHISSEMFEPIADDITKVSLYLLGSAQDPDIRKALYGLFAAMSTVLKERISPILPVVMESIITSMKNVEGVVVATDKEDDDNAALNVYGSEDEGEEEEEDLDVVNDFVEEKEESCIALKELAENSGESFYPYLEVSFVESMKLLDFPSDEVKSAAAEACFQLAICFANINTPDGQRAAGQILSNLVSKGSLMVKLGLESEVVSTILECFHRLLTELGNRLDTHNRDNIMSCVKMIFFGEAACQKLEEDEDEIDDDEIWDSALDILPALGSIITNQEFIAFTSQFTTPFKKRLENSKSTHTRANVIACLAECCPYFGQYLCQQMDPYFSYALCSTKDTDAEVRNNAVYMLGEYCLHAKETALNNYPLILNALSQVMTGEKEAKVIDNVCGALARLIIANQTAVPTDSVVSAMMKHLPLKEDFVEDKWVYRSLGQLYQSGDKSLLNHMPVIVSSALVSLDSHMPDDETKMVLAGLIKLFSQDFPEEFRMAASQLPVELLGLLQQIVQ